MKRLCFIVVALLTLSSCTYTAYYIDNNYKFKHATSTLVPEGSDISNQKFQDDYLTIELQEVAKEYIYLTLTNNSTSTMRILWDEAAFIDYNGYSHRINHDNSAISKKLSEGKSLTLVGKSLALSTYGGTSTVVDKNKVQIPTVIPAGSRVNTVIIPADNAQIMRFGDVSETTYPDSKAASVFYDRFKARIKESTLKILLPIEVNGTKIEYTTTIEDEFQTRILESKVEWSFVVTAICLLIVVGSVV